MHDVAFGKHVRSGRQTERLSSSSPHVKRSIETPLSAGGVQSSSIVQGTAQPRSPPADAHTIPLSQSLSDLHGSVGGSSGVGAGSSGWSGAKRQNVSPASEKSSLSQTNPWGHGEASHSWVQ